MCGPGAVLTFRRTIGGMEGSTTTAYSTVADRIDGSPVTRTHRAITAVIGASLFFDIYDIFLAGTIGTVLVKKFHASAVQTPLLLGSGFFGMFVGAVVMGRVADALGRRTAILINIGIYSLFTLLAAFSSGIEMLVALRFVAGVGIGAQPPLCDSYLNEVLPGRSRGRLIAWAYTLSFVGVPVVGFLARFLVPVSPLGLDGWRWLFVLGGVGGAVVWLLVLRFVPESPRWLGARGRGAEAARGAASLASPAAGSGSDDLPSSESGRRVSLSVLLSPEYLRRTVMLFVFHVFQTVGYYGFGTLVPLVLAAKGYPIVSSLTFTALSFLGYPVGSALSVLVIDRVDRKWLVVGSALLMAVLGILFGAAGTDVTIVLFGFLYTLVSNVFSNAYHVFQGEIFPTGVRATAAGSAYSLSRLASGAMPFVLLPVLHSAGPTVMFVVVATCMLIVMADIAALGPRTTGRPLEYVNPS